MPRSMLSTFSIFVIFYVTVDLLHLLRLTKVNFKVLAISYMYVCSKENNLSENKIYEVHNILSMARYMAPDKIKQAYAPCDPFSFPYSATVGGIAGA